MKYEYERAVRDEPLIDYSKRDKWSDESDKITIDNIEDFKPLYRGLLSMRLVKAWTTGKTQEPTSVEKKIDALINSKKRYYPVLYKVLFDRFDECHKQAEKDAALYIYKNNLKYFSKRLENINYFAYIIEIEENKNENS